MIDLEDEMSTEIKKSRWIGYAKPGDIGLTLGSSSIFAKFQDWYRSRISNASNQASHGFIVKGDNLISEANGKYIGESKLEKYIGSNRDTWLFRKRDLKLFEKDAMMLYIKSAEQTGGTYSWLGIMQFVQKFFYKDKQLKDKPGVFCTEYTSRIINAADLPYLSLGKDFPWKVTPSIQLSWFIKNGFLNDWELVLYSTKNKLFFNAGSS